MLRLGPNSSSAQDPNSSSAQDPNSSSAQDPNSSSALAQLRARLPDVAPVGAGLGLLGISA
ncbi:MAG: hypothetical protein ACRDQG_17300, partial [Pseudonocardiaceae bacterium]